MTGFLLVMLCVSVSCEVDMIAVRGTITYEQCREIGETIYEEHDVTWMCIKDLKPTDEWSSFE